MISPSASSLNVSSRPRTTGYSIRQLAQAPPQWHLARQAQLTFTWNFSPPCGWSGVIVQPVGVVEADQVATLRPVFRNVHVLSDRARPALGGAGVGELITTVSLVALLEAPACHFAVLFLLRR